MNSETDEASALEAIDYLIDDVVADAYVRGAEGLSTETSPQSARTLHDAIAQAISTARAEGHRAGMEQAARLIEQIPQSAGRLNSDIATAILAAAEDTP